MHGTSSWPWPTNAWSSPRATANDIHQIADLVNRDYKCGGLAYRVLPQGPASTRTGSWKPWVDPRVYPMSAVALSGAYFALLLAFAVAGVVLMAQHSAVFLEIIAIGSTLTSVIGLVQLRH